MPPTQTSASEVVSSRDAPGPERLHRFGEALERVPAHIEAERFLLERELLDLRPAGRVGQRHRAAGPSSIESPNS